MNIFRKRPLSLILCIWLGVFFLFSLQESMLRWALVLISILPLIFSLVFNFENRGKIILRVISGVSCLAMLFSFCYFDIYFYPNNYFGESVKIVGTVTDYSASSTYSTKFTLETESINDNPFLRYKINLYLPKSDAGEIIEGTRISFNANLQESSKESKSYNTSIGISGYADNVGNLEILEQTNGGIKGVLSRYKEWLSRYVTMLTDSESGALLSALLLGQRDMLSGQVRLDFQRIGISHLLALSGMHLAILSLGLEKLLSALGVKKKTRLALSSAFIIFYMALTGFSVSVMRAGFMLILASILFVLSYGKDSITSLFVAMTIICILDPCAIFSTSLWLSALATIGIIVLGEYSGSTIKKPKTKRDAILKYLWLGFMASVFAISATIGISSATFGGLSILGIFTTLVFSIVVEIIMYLGCITMLLGGLLPLGFIIAPMSKVVVWLSGVLSSGEHVYISTNYAFVKFIIGIYVVIFFLFILLSIRKKRETIIALVTAFAFINICPLIFSVVNDNREQMIYTSDSKCDEILVRSHGRACLISSSQYSKNLAYTSLDLLEEAKITYLDAFYLTHYSWSIDDELDVLLSDVLVERIYLPKPQNDDENTILNVIKKSVEDYRTKLVLVGADEVVRVGDYKIKLIYSTPYSEGTSTNVFYLKSENEMITYISSGILDSDTEKYVAQHIEDSDILILGEHGKSHKNPVYISDAYNKASMLIMNSKNIFLTQSSMQEYIDNGCEVIAHPETSVYIKK